MIHETAAAPEAAASEVRWSLRDVVVGTLVALVGGLGLAVVAFMPTPEADLGGDLPESVALTIGAVVSGVWLVATVWWFSVRKYGMSWEDLGLKRPIHRRAVWFAVLALVASLTFTAAYGALTTAIGIEILIPEPIPEELLGEGIVYVVAVLVIVTVVPWSEELLFRGFIFPGLTARFGVYTAAAASAAAFALAHASVGNAVPIFVTGLLFAWAYWLTRSIWVPAAAHAGQNLIAVWYVGTVLG